MRGQAVALLALAGTLPVAACKEITPAPQIVHARAEETREKLADPSTCDNDWGSPHSCAYLPARTKECALASEALPGCKRLVMSLVPRAAEAATRCLYNKTLDTCDVYEPDAMSDCFLAALSAACPDPRAAAACAGPVATCDGQLKNELTLPTCVAAYSAVIDSQKEELLACATSRCNADCFDRLAPGREATLGRTTLPRHAHAPEPTGKWVDAKLPMPAGWTSCKLDTDCTVVVGSCCDEFGVNRMFSSFAYHTLDRTADGACSDACTYHPRAACEEGRCVLVASEFPPASP